MLAGDVVILLGAAVVAMVAGGRIGVPPIVAYLAAGVAVGPTGLGLVSDSAEIHELAELGVALLLFGIGIELSLDTLRRMLGRLLVAGGVQVAGTVGLAVALLGSGGVGLATAVIVGFAVALSSTAIVFKLYDEAGESDAPTGHAAAAFLLFQDVTLVPMMLLVPALAAPSEGIVLAAARALVVAAATVVGSLAVVRRILPRLLERLGDTGIPEVFPLTAVVVAFGTALLAHLAGLSLPIGAFLAGLALSGSRYAHRVFAELLPLRDACVALFFTSIGMLLRPTVLADDLDLVVAILGVVAVKGLLVGAVVAALWRSRALAVQTAFALAQVGEFAFVLTAEGSRHGIVPPAMEQAILCATIITMAATPFLVRTGRRLAYTGAGTPGRSDSSRSGHVLVLGCGETGTAVARVLREAGVPYVAVDLLADRVEAGLADGLTVHLGDVSRRAVLDAVGAARARVAVVTVGDPGAVRRIVALLRELNPGARIIARARRAAEIPELERLGADDVLPSEFAVSIDIFVTLLRHLGVPRHVVRIQESLIRAERYRALRGLGTSADLLTATQRVIAGTMIETVEVMPHSDAVGRSLGDLALAQTGTLVLSIVRGQQPLPAPGGQTHLQAGDLVVLFGPHQAIARATALLEPPAPRRDDDA